MKRSAFIWILQAMAAQVIVEKSARGNLRFVNCGFWGPAHHNAVLRGDRFVSFSDCYFSNDRVTGEFAVQAESGKFGTVWYKVCNLVHEDMTMGPANCSCNTSGR